MNLDFILPHSHPHDIFLRGNSFFGLVIALFFPNQEKARGKMFEEEREFGGWIIRDNVKVEY